MPPAATPASEESALEKSLAKGDVDNDGVKLHAVDDDEKPDI